MITLTAEGEQELLRLLAEQSIALRLYQNDVTPGYGDKAARFREAQGYGYAPVAIPASEWKLTHANGTPPAMARPQHIFRFTGPLGPVYGYFLTTKAGALLAAERFRDAPWNVRYNGDEIAVPLTLMLA